VKSRFHFDFSSPEDTEALRRFSARLQGTGYGHWPLKPDTLDGADPDDEFPVRLRRILAGDGTEIRAQQDFYEHQLYIDGDANDFVWPRGPLSEAVLDPKYGMYGFALLRHGMRLQPFQMALAHLRLDEPPGSLFAGLGWKYDLMPGFIYPVRPAKVFRELAFFRSTPRRMQLSRLARFSGAAHALQAGLALHNKVSRLRRDYRVTEFDRFEPWTDELWNSLVTKYKAVTRRDAAAMNRLYAPGDTRFRKYRVQKGGRDVGWFMTTCREMANHPSWGNLHTGVILDALADPSDAHDMLSLAKQTLLAEKVDVIISYWSHTRWKNAAKRLAFIPRQTGFYLFVSKAGQDRVLTKSCPLDAIHFTRSDCDGADTFAPPGPRDPEPDIAYKKEELAP